MSIDSGRPGSGPGCLQKVSNDWADSECWHQERDTFSSDTGQSRMEVEFEERFRSAERGMWECRIGIEGVRFVPLEERMVTSTGKELRMMSVSTFIDIVASFFRPGFGFGPMLVAHYGTRDIHRAADWIAARAGT